MANPPTTPKPDTDPEEDPGLGQPPPLDEPETRSLDEQILAALKRILDRLSRPL